MDARKHWNDPSNECGKDVELCTYEDTVVLTMAAKIGVSRHDAISAQNYSCLDVIACLRIHMTR
jgi:hypothetical protein